MDKEEYYKRIEKINNRFKTDRVGAYEEYQSVCQKNYLSTKYIENLEQQVKKQKEIINKLNFIKNRKNQGASQENINKMAIEFVNSWLKEVSEWK